MDGIAYAMNMNLDTFWEMVRTGRPGMLHSMGSQRVGHDWATEQHYYRIKPWRQRWGMRGVEGSRSQSLFLLSPKLC